MRQVSLLPLPAPTTPELRERFRNLREPGVGSVPGLRPRYDINGKTVAVPALKVCCRICHGFCGRHNGAPTRVVKGLQLWRAVRLVDVSVQPSHLTVRDRMLDGIAEGRGQTTKIAVDGRRGLGRPGAHITPSCGSPLAHS